MIVSTEVDSFDDGAGTTTRWSVDVHLGGELAPAELVGHLVGCARSLVRRML